MIDRLRYSFLALVLVGLTLILSSWNDEERRAIIGPLPPEPDYADSTQWYMVDRGGEADLFYIYFEKDKRKRIIIMEPNEEMEKLIRGAVPQGAYQVN